MNIKKYFTKGTILTLLKYAFSFVLILLAFQTTGSVRYATLQMTELFLIFAVSNLLLAKSKKFGWLGSFFLLIFNAQCLVLFFGGNYVTYVMLENINSLRDLEGKAFIYGIGVVGVLVFSFLPARCIWEGQRKKRYLLAAGAALAELCAVLVAGAQYSPYRAICGICEQWNMQRSLYSSDTWENDESLETFLNGGTVIENPEEIVEATETVIGTEAVAMEAEVQAESDQMPEIGQGNEKSQKEQVNLFADTEEKLQANYSCNINRPNVILIFTEGLSQNVVSDPRSIMPNVAAMEKKSLNFVNYYNHTFATYRGLIGQLYSGHQREDGDANRLISIEDILRDQGYWTAMINTEPNNATFDAYLKSLSFDEVISDPALCDGAVDAFSDRAAYEYLYDTAIRYNDEKNQPFFLAIYTFGTHASLDSVDQTFGDGSYRVLNRFYDMDYQFGQFIEKFSNSPLAANTIIVFTADHATYADQDFLAAFSDYERPCSDADEIPFFIYSVGGPVAQVDAQGRNSLDLAPTLLHYLNVEGQNYFLGDSLFYEKKQGISFDTFFYDPAYIRYTGNDCVEVPSDAEIEIILDGIRKYFSVSIRSDS